MYEFTASIPPLVGQEFRWKFDQLIPGQSECFQLGTENLVAVEFRKNILVNSFYLLICFVWQCYFCTLLGPLLKQGSVAVLFADGEGI